MADDELKPRFAPGDRVRVDTREHQGHHRTPVYVKGRSGVIARVWGAYPNPEELAYGKPGLPRIPLYDVVFNQHDLWQGYAGSRGDTLHIDIYDHWLEPGEEAK